MEQIFHKQCWDNWELKKKDTAAYSNCNLTEIITTKQSYKKKPNTSQKNRYIFKEDTEIIKGIWKSDHHYLSSIKCESK